MFIKETLSVTKCTQQQSEVLESISAEMTFKHQEWNIVGCYKPPGAHRRPFLLELEKTLLEQNLSNPTIVVGDFNVDVHEGRGEWLVRFMREKFNLQLVDTSVTTWEHTRIDLIFSNQQSIDANSLLSSWSKHNLLIGHVG